MADQPISFIDPEIQRCPFAAYAALREQGPVYYDASCGYYIVTGYDEVRKWAADTINLSNVTGLLLVKDAPYQPRIDAIYEEHGFLPVNTLTVSDPPLLPSIARWSTRYSAPRGSGRWRIISRASSTG